MRIALVHNLPSGGAKRHTFEQVRELARRGHEIVEFVPATADLRYCSLAPYVKKQRVFDLTPWVETERHFPLITPYLHAVQGIATLRRSARVSRAMATEIDEDGFDLALAKDCRIAVNPQALQYLRTPSAFQCHHGLRHRTERLRDGGLGRRSIGQGLRELYHRPARWLFDRELRQNELRSARAATMVLTNSEFSKGLISEQYGVAAQVVYPGIDTWLFQPRPVGKAGFVLCTAALVYSKGYRFLVSALSRVPSARRPQLMIVANSVDPEEARLVQEMAARAGVDLQLRRIFDDEELVRTYSQARVFVYAPLNEALGLAPLEAMACGTPVVAVAEGGVRETVADGLTGWLVPRDPTVFGDRLDALLQDDETRARMGQAGVEYVREKWTWSRAVDILEGHLKALPGTRSMQVAQ